MLLSHGRALYIGAGGLAPANFFSSKGIAYQQGYNVADYLLDIASDPPAALFQATEGTKESSTEQVLEGASGELEKGYGSPRLGALPKSTATVARGRSRCATTFLTQLEVLSGREWKFLRRYVAIQHTTGPFRLTHNRSGTIHFLSHT